MSVCQEVVEFLISEGADIEAACKDGDTVLTKAAETGRRGCVRPHTMSCPWIACSLPRSRLGKTQSINCLIVYAGASMFVQAFNLVECRECLVLSYRLKSIFPSFGRILRALIRAGVEINAPRRDDGATALHMAALTGNTCTCFLVLQMCVLEYRHVYKLSCLKTYHAWRQQSPVTW
jgi:hypothetical protein